MKYQSQPTRRITGLKRILMVLLAAVIIASDASSTVLATATDINFYSGNDIIYYDPNGVACKPGSGASPDSGTISGSDTAEKIFNFLTTTTFKGLNNTKMNSIQAAGVLGNFQRESGMNPAQKQIGGGGGRGLAQWDDRRFALFAFADSEGKDWTDLSLQLDFIKKEINGSEGPGLVRAGFLTVSTPKEAAVVFEDAYERAGVKAYAERIKYAEEYYARFASTAGGAPTTGSPTAPTTTTSGCRSTATGPIGDFMSDSFISYAQCVSSPGGGAWGDQTDTHGQKMCAVGCGPTSLAMVIRNLAGTNVTPEDTRKYYNDNNLWTSFGSGPAEMRKAGEHFGLRTEPMDPRQLDNYKKVFEAGGLVVIGGTGAVPFYTDFGHYVVVRGITEDGKFRISDPGRGLVKDFDVDQIMASTSDRVDNATAFYAK